MTQVFNIHQLVSGYSSASPLEPSCRREPVSEEFADKSDLELQALIGRAEHELQRRKLVSKEKLKEEIEEKLRNAGLDLGDLFPEAGGRGRKTRAISETSEARPVKA